MRQSSRSPSISAPSSAVSTGEMKQSAMASASGRRAEREEERRGGDHDQQRAQAVVEGGLARRPARAHPGRVDDGADQAEGVAQEGDLERGIARATAT